MPQVSRQRPTGPAAAPTPKQVENNHEQEGMPLKIVIYGESKSGKTRLVSTFPKPILIIGQDGTKSIATGKRLRKELAFLKNGFTASGNPLYALTVGGRDLHIDLCVLHAGVHMMEALDIADKGGYQTVCLDTGRTLYDIHTKEVLQLDEVPTVRAFGMAQQAQWGAINSLFINSLFKLFNLGEQKGISTPIIAHEADLKKDDTPSDIVKPKIGPDLPNQVRKWLNGEADFICQMFVNRKEIVQQVEGGGTVRQFTGDFEHCLRIGRHDVYITGFRTIADELPAHITNPTYEKICAVIEGKQV